MQEVSWWVCPAAVLIKCRHTGMEVVMTIVEKSNSADNYRGDILGAIMIQLVLHTASQTKGTSNTVKMVHIALTRALCSM